MRVDSWKVKMKFSFPFSMAVLHRFLSQAEVYLKEDSHHRVMEEIFSRMVEIDIIGRDSRRR
ncbi:hypothetical protein BJV77DRAFT_1034015 [Russula vinacea]|jgi:hypothetical protein|nr:hypothetical protein BJV77DRAFT_1034015 [Russula vinacea]